MLSAKQRGLQMQVYSFRGPGRVFGFTADPTGANLPSQYAPWNQFKTIEMNKGEANPAVNTGECLDDIERFGYHLTDAHVRITQRDPA
jgi:hypothetical protein